MSRHKHKWIEVRTELEGQSFHVVRRCTICGARTEYLYDPQEPDA